MPLAVTYGIILIYGGVLISFTISVLDCKQLYWIAEATRTRIWKVEKFAGCFPILSRKEFKVVRLILNIQTGVTSHHSDRINLICNWTTHVTEINNAECGSTHIPCNILRIEASLIEFEWKTLLHQQLTIEARGKGNAPMIQHVQTRTRLEWLYGT